MQENETNSIPVPSVPPTDEQASGAVAPTKSSVDTSAFDLHSEMFSSPAAEAVYVIGSLFLSGFGIFVIAQIGVWPFLKLSLSIIWFVVWTSAAGVAVVCGVFYGFIALLRLTRPRRVEVFLSYQHELQIPAANVSNAIRKSDISVKLIPFAPRRSEHDAVIQEVTSNIRTADVVVVVPADKGGFFEAEILAASTLLKPVILLAVENRFRLPDTAYSGYPVFAISQLGTREFRPLQQMIHIAAGSKSSVDDARREVMGDSLIGVFLFIVALTLMLIPFMVPFVVAMCIAVIVLWAWGGLDTVAYWFAAGENIGMWLYAGAFPLILLANTLKTFQANKRLRDNVRQRCQTRKLSTQDLADLLANRESMRGILDSLRRR